jgi:AcrR family transcriptional regulator
MTPTKVTGDETESATAQTMRRRRTQRERREESSRRLIGAAVELIAEQGFARTTAVEIAERAGYSREMVRTRFGTKNDLIDSLLRANLEDRLTEPPGPDVSGLEHWLGRLDYLRRIAAEQPEFVRACFVLSFEGASHDSWLRERATDWVRRAETAVAGFVRVGQHDGSIRTEVDAPDVAEQFMTEAIGLAFRWVCQPNTYDFDTGVVRWRDSLRARYESSSSRSVTT